MVFESTILQEIEKDLRNAGVSGASIDTALSMFNDFERNKNEQQGSIRNAINDWGKRASERFSSSRSNINFIPGIPTSKCYDLLVVVSKNNDEFNNYTIKAIAHCIYCAGTTKAVLLISYGWDKDFDTFRKPMFEALYTRFGISLIGVSYHGGGWWKKLILP